MPHRRQMWQLWSCRRAWPTWCWWPPPWLCSEPKWRSPFRARDGEAALSTRRYVTARTDELQLFKAKRRKERFAYKQWVMEDWIMKRGSWKNDDGQIDGTGSRRVKEVCPSVNPNWGTALLLVFFWIKQDQQIFIYIYIYIYLYHLSDSLSLCLQALERFYEAVMQGILRHINFDGKAAVHSHTLCSSFASHSSPLFWFVPLTSNSVSVSFVAQLWFYCCQNVLLVFYHEKLKFWILALH